MGESVFCLVEGARCLRVVACDPFTGTIQKVYNCQSSDVEGGATCISHMNNNNLLCALQKKPILCVWNLRKEQTVSKISLPGLVSALVCSPNGNFCAAAIGEKIYVWEVCTGHLLAVASNHYQTINVLKFSDDGVHLISGAKDCRVIVWRFSNLLAEANMSSGFKLPYTSAYGTQLSPSVVRHIWSDHSLPVTDIWCGFGGLQCRVATVSMDQTCKLYEICSGKLLCSFLLDMALTSVVMDKAEQLTFVGGVNGKIAQVNLFLQHTRQLHKLDGILESDSNQHAYFNGHTKAITGLTVSHCNTQLMLISTSMDGEVRLWDLPSHQTIKVIQHKGCISRMFTLIDAFVEYKSDQTQVKQFGKHLYHNSKSQDEVETTECVPVQICGMDPLFDLAGIGESLFLYDQEDQNKLSTPQGLFTLLSEREDVAAKQSKERTMLYNVAMEELTF